MPTYSMPDDGTGNPQQPEPEPSGQPEQPAPEGPVDRFFRKCVEALNANAAAKASQSEPEPAEPAPTVPCAWCGQPAMVDALPDDPTERLCLACWRLVGMRDAVRGWHHKYTDWPGGRQPSRNLLLPGHCEAEFDETARRAWQRPNPWDSDGEWDM